MNEGNDDAQSKTSPMEAEAAVTQQTVVPGDGPASVPNPGASYKYPGVAIFVSGVIVALVLLAIAQWLSLSWVQILEICLLTVPAASAVKITWNVRIRSLICLALVGMFAISRAFAADAIKIPGQSTLAAYYFIVAVLAGLTFLGRLAEQQQTAEPNKQAVPGFLLLLLLALGASNVIQNQRRRYAAPNDFQSSSAKAATSRDAKATGLYWNNVVLPYLRELRTPNPEDNIEKWLDEFDRSRRFQSGPTIGEGTGNTDKQLISEFEQLLRPDETIRHCARRRLSQRTSKPVDNSIEGKWLREHQTIEALLSAPPEQVPGDLVHLRGAIVEQDDALVKMYNLHIRLAERYPASQFFWVDGPSNENSTK